MIKTAISLLICTFLYHSFCQAESTPFTGLYAGLDVGNQYMFGGAQVDGVETIGDGNVFIFGGLLGWRKSYENHLLLGVEAQLNQPFDEFENTSNPDGTIVTYKIKPQSAVQFNMGYVWGEKRRNVVFGYFAINQTRFDIDIYRGPLHFEQTDFENFGRVGVGYEYLFSKKITARLLVGTSMDALPGTNNGLDGKLNFLYNFGRK